MVAMIDRLVKAGLVLRQPSPIDRRIKHIILTDAGKALYGQVLEQAVAFRAELLAGIDPTELAAATRLLERLQAAVEPKT